MENQIYRIEMSSKYKLEFYVCETNELNPYRVIKEMGVILYDKNDQIDGELNTQQLDSLINYLTDCKHYIEQFNSESKPQQSEECKS